MPFELKQSAVLQWTSRDSSHGGNREAVVLNLLRTRCCLSMFLDQVSDFVQMAPSLILTNENRHDLTKHVRNLLLAGCCSSCTLCILISSITHAQMLLHLNKLALVQGLLKAVHKLGIALLLHFVTQSLQYSCTIEGIRCLR